MAVLHDEARALFAGPDIAPVATLLADDGPRSVPVRTGVEGEYLALFTSPTSRKGRNLTADDRTAVSVTGRENWVYGALVRGRVVQRAGGDAGWEIAGRIVATYAGGRCPQREDGGAFLVTPVQVIVAAFG